MGDIFDQVGDVFDQVAKSGGPPTNVADKAKANLATGMGGGIPGKKLPPLTAAGVKANPPTATSWQGPTADYGYAPTKLKAAPDSPILNQVAGMGASMLSSMDNLGRRVGMKASPIRQMLVDPKTGQPRKELDMGALSQPPAPLPENSIANVTRDISGSTGLPIPDPTNYGMPRMFSDAYDASYKRLESGQSNSDMFKLPLTMAAAYGGFKAAPRIGRALLPADIAAERAQAAQQSALGTTPKNFEQGATPDTATLQDPAGSVYRSQGRQLKGIQADKGAEYDALEKDMSAPKYQNKVSDPMTSINPVLDDALSRADPTQATRIGEFRSLILSQVGKLSNGNMQLNPAQLVQMKRWMDGFISVYKDEPIGTVRDMAQNVRKAIKDHLTGEAPESSVRGQRIQSLIQAEEALDNKIHTPPPEAQTIMEDVRRLYAPVFQSTLLRTSKAALLKKMSGGLLDRPSIPTGTAGSANPPNPQGGPPGSVPTIDFQSQPTHVEVGQQVSGHTAAGDLVSGELKKMYAVVENGVPQWKALVLDLKKGKIVDLPADQVFSRTEGPPGPKGEPTDSGHTLDSKTASETLGPFNPPTERDFSDAAKLKVNASNPFPSKQDLKQRLVYDYAAHKLSPNDTPYLSPATAADTLGRAKSKPLGTPPVVLDRTKNTPGQIQSTEPVKPEEMALVKDAAARLANRFPGAIRNISRIELIDNRHVKPGEDFLARYESNPGGNVKVNIQQLRREISINGLNGTDATLIHELTHSAQHVLGVKGAAEALEYPAYRNTFKTLGKFDNRYGEIPLSPKELKHGTLEPWRTKVPQK